MMFEDLTQEEKLHVISMFNATSKALIETPEVHTAGSGSSEVIKWHKNSSYAPDN